MKRLKRLRNNPGKEVPEHLLLTAFRWETMREQYFLNLNWFDAATEARAFGRSTQNASGTNSESPSTSNEI
jgi:hypothetical protein